MGTTTTNSSNLLNDFQQGTFTPTLTFGGGNTGQSIAYQYGNYQKIGFNCYIQIGMSISNIGTDTGSAKVALPFPVYNNTGSTQWEGVLNLWFLANGGTMPTGSQAVASDTNGGIVFADWNSATLLTHTEFGTNPNFRISGHYRIA